MSAVLRPSRSSFPDQDHVAIFHLQLQRVEARTFERAPAHLVGEDAVRFHARRLENADLTVQGLVTSGNAGVAEQSHGWNNIYFVCPNCALSN